MKKIYILSLILLSALSANALNFGKDFSGDYHSAFVELKKKAENGNAGAQNDLGRFYESGFGTDKNYPKAIYWYKKALENGQYEGAINLGNIYSDGTGVAKDYKKAIKYYTIAMENGKMGGGV